MAELDTDVADGEGGRVASGKVSLAALTALGIGSMIGGGIFGLPQQMADAAAPGPLIIGWLITGAGMLMLAFVYQRLAINLPEINAGVYGYARAGFGNLVGFSSAWGYWLSAWIGNVGYLVLLMASLGVFLPGFGNGNTALAIGIASVVMWMYHALILRGIREAAIINAIVTVGKVLPLIVFVLIGLFAFKLDIFTHDFWGSAVGTGFGAVVAQVKNMMLVTVWVFIGVEGASVFSERARTRADIGRATIRASSLSWPFCSPSTFCPTASSLAPSSPSWETPPWRGCLRRQSVHGGRSSSPWDSSSPWWGPCCPGSSCWPRSCVFPPRRGSCPRSWAARTLKPCPSTPCG